MIKSLIHALDEMYIKYKDTEEKKGLKKDIYANTEYLRKPVYILNAARYSLGVF